MLINIFQRTLIINFMEDKILKFIILFKISGMTHKNYIFSQIISNIIFITIFIFLGTSIIFLYQKFFISFTQIIFVLVSLLFSFALVNFNLFISLFFRNPILAIDLSNMITFVLNIVTIILIFIESPFVFVMKIVPYTSYYSIIKEYIYTEELIFDNIKFDTFLLFLNFLFFSVVYYFLENLLRDDNGMNKSIFDIFYLLKKNFEEKKNYEENFDLLENDEENVLVLQNVSKKFKDFEIKNFSYKFKKNKFYCIIGKNGCGKSTILNLASGLFKKDKGEIFFLNKKLSSENFSSKIGFCASENILMENLTVFQHLKLFSIIKNIKNQKTQISQILKIFDLQKYQNYFPKQLSGGNKRKLSIALSYLGKPELVLLDEPSSSLDPFSKFEIFKLLKKLQREFKTTIICTSHNFDEIEVFPENVVMLNKGQILIDGHLNEIKEYFDVGHEFKLITKNGFDFNEEIFDEIKNLVPGKKIVENNNEISIFLKASEKSEIIKIFEKTQKYKQNFTYEISSNLLQNAIHHSQIKKEYSKITTTNSQIKSILKNMKTTPISSKSLKILSQIKMRLKFNFTNPVQIATFILVNIFLILFLLYNLLFIQNALPNLSINGCMLCFSFTFVFIEGYNNMNYVFFLVYEKSFNIKKLLLTNGVSVGEYYFSRIFADFILNTVLYCFYLTLGFFLIKLKIRNDLFTDYQLFLLMVAIFLWKNSFLIGNYLLSFIFFKTNCVIKNYYIVYFVLSGILFLLSSYFPLTYYLSDFCYIFEIASNFTKIEQNLFKIFIPPIFQIILYYLLINYIEHKKLYHNYNIDNRKKKEERLKKSNKSLKSIDMLSANQDLNSFDYFFEVENLQKIYKNQKISLNKLSFKLQSKTCFGLIGSNGAGKSTFFNILISEIQKSTGNIYFH